MSANSFQVFKTIEIGTFKDVKSLSKALEESYAVIGYWARNILNKIILSKSKQSLDLVVVSVRELGFPKGAKLEDIYKAAKKQGLDLCPDEVGPQLRLQYPDQPSGEWLKIAMEPIRDYDGVLSLFSVECPVAASWLYACYGIPDLCWLADDRFVFVRRK